MMIGNCHGVLIFYLFWTILGLLLACPLPSPWGDQAEKSDMLGDAKGVQVRPCCRRVSGGHFGSHGAILEHVWMHFVSVLEQDFDASLKES